MGVAKTVFSRYEMKFMLTKEQYENVVKGFGDKMELDEYNIGGNLYTIMNLYYDTEHSDLVSTGLKREDQYRFKIRLRSYDPSYPTAFLEIKKKVNGLVNKRRTLMYIDDVNPFLIEHVDVPYSKIIKRQVVKEIDVIAKNMALMPKVVLCYDRQAFFGTQSEDGDLRVTFDTNIRARRDELDLRLGSHGQRILDENYVLMEVKVDKSVPLWLARLMSENNVRKRRFSKYGTEFSQYVLKRYLQEEDENERVFSNV
ncbi:MAG: polyphosphate polymerase domain-containing protein [Clostridia bacterium]|nr:polyphosphate polymerase domain-containing protein [Clostridia bacterium]